MKLDLVQVALISTLLTSLAACGGHKKDSGSPNSDLESVDTKGSEKFNMATFIRENPRTQILKNYVSPGDSSLFFGQKDKFYIESNMTLDSQGEKGFIFGGPRAVTAAYWLDGFVFGKKMGGNAPRGFLIDVGATADLATTTLEAHFRFLGQDKFSGQVDGIYENTFVRDLSIEPIFYPVPLLGIRVAGNIGGELGLRTELGVKTPDSINLNFKPKSQINAGLSSSIELIHFLSAKVEGIVNLMSFDLASAADLGYIKAANYLYGHNGVDGGQLQALDGKIEISAKAGVTGILPAGVDARLWNLLGVDPSQTSWSHTIWDPKPVLTDDLPAYGNSFMKFSSKPKNLSDCEQSVALVTQKLDEHAAMLGEHSKSLEGMDAVLAQQSIKYLAEINDSTQKYCQQFK